MNSRNDTPDPSLALTAGLEVYRRLIVEDAALAAEFEASLPVFFDGAVPEPHDPLVVLASSRRHLEWFLFERHSPALMDLPVEALGAAWRANAGELQALEENFLTSVAGIYEVTAVVPGEGAELSDLSGLSTHPTRTSEDLFQVGDLIVGRLYPVGDGTYIPSIGVGIFREPSLIAAVKRDIETIREGRDRAVFRVAQKDLETMFFTDKRHTPVAGEAPTIDDDAVARAEAWLFEQGLGAERVAQLFAALASAPPDPNRIALGSNDALGEILNTLAFETEIDLEAAREKLFAAWTVMHRPRAIDAGTGEPAPPTLEFEAAVGAFERDCESGKQVIDALSDLERRLRVADDEPAEGEDVAPDFPGVVGAMVDEFLWEEEREHGPEAVREADLLRIFSDFAKDVGIFEELSNREVLTFATCWIPDNPDNCEPERAPRLISSLKRFCHWAREHQGADKIDADQELSDLHGALPRVLAINSALEGRDGGALYEVVSARDGEIQLTSAGGATESASVPAAVCREFRPGDYVRARRTRGVLVPERAYPPQLRDLLGQRSAE